MSAYEMIQRGLDAIEEKFNVLATRQREFADDLLQIKQKGISMPGEGIDGADGKDGNISRFILKQIDDNRDLLSKTKSLRFEVKAASDVVTSASGRNIVPGGVGVPTGLPFGVQNGLRQTPSGGVSAIEYFRYTGIEGGGSVQAGEGALKGAVRPTHTAVTQAALTVAGWTKISRQAMNDSAELRQALDVTLTREIGKALDAAVMNANANPAWDGLNALATAYTSLKYTTLWDAASEAVSSMMTAGFVPDTVVVTPADWLSIQVAVNATTGDYFSGSYLGALPESLRGLRVVVSPSLGAGKIMVLDSQQIELRVVDGFAVEVNYVDDDFIRNQATILGELRVIPVFRSVGAARLITPKA